MRKIKLLSIVVVLAVILTLTQSIQDGQQANALGAQTETFTSALPWDFWRATSEPAPNWFYATDVAPAALDGSKIYQSDFTVKAYLYSSNDPLGNWIYYSRLLLDWNTDAIGNGAIQSGRIKLFINKSNGGGVKWSCRFTAFTGPADGNYGLEDWLAQIDKNSIGLAEPIIYDTIESGAWNSFELTQAGLDYINGEGHTVIWVRFSVEALDSEPACGGNSHEVSYALDTSGDGRYAKLEVEYSGEPAPRIIDEKENEDEDAGTGDNITGISYMTPRNAWDDEKVGFRAEGDDGTQIALQLISDEGVIVDNITDEIRPNGYFYWYPELEGYTGYFRCVEANHNKRSEWGYSAHYIAPGGCVSLAKYLESEATSWRRDIQEFIVSSPEIMTYFWVSDLSEDELDSILSVSQDGARQKIIWTDNVSEVASGYMRCQDSDNYNLLSSRYILAAMEGAGEDWDGLILNFENPLNTQTRGFYYLGLWNGEEGFTGSTAYWFCGEAELGIEISGDFSNGKAIDVVVSSASELNLAHAFNTSELGLSQVGRTWNWLDTSGLLSYGAWSAGELALSVTPAVEGDYIVELRLSADDYIEHRIWDCTISLTGGGAVPPGGGEDVDMLRDVGSWFNQLLKLLHMNSPGGRWLFICLCCLAECIFLWGMKLILTLALCLTVGLGMFAGWIWPWVIILLGLVVGFVLFELLRGRRRAED